MALSADIVAGVAKRLASYAGLELPAWVVEARAALRMELLGLAPSAYLTLIESPRGLAELSELVEAVRVGETRLFRHRLQIAALVEHVAPVLRVRARRIEHRKVLRVWSAGCSNGEEAYTLAAVLHHALPDFAVSVLATDVSADAIEAARRATYPASALADIPDEWTSGFVTDGDRVTVSAELRAMVQLERDNLVDIGRSKELGSFDLVWCRNVLIYFTQAARKKAIDRLVHATVPGGFVFVGYSESLRDVAELDAIRYGEVVYYTRRDASATLAPRSRTPTGNVQPMTPRPLTPALGVPTTPPIRDSAWDVRTPVPQLIPTKPPPNDVVAVKGQSNARLVTAELTARLGVEGLRRLVVDLDTAELLGDDLAPVLRRARAAAHAAGVELVVRATKTGARRWLARHGLDAEVKTEDAP